MKIVMPILGLDDFDFEKQCTKVVEEFTEWSNDPRDTAEMWDVIQSMLHLIIFSHDAKTVHKTAQDHEMKLFLRCVDGIYKRIGDATIEFRKSPVKKLQSIFEEWD